MTKEYENVHMAQTAQGFLDESRAINEAITKHFVSPGLVNKVVLFAAEQDLHFTQYVPSSGLFFLSDGEGYSAKAVLEYFNVDTSRLVLPTAVDEPIDATIEEEVEVMASALIYAERYLEREIAENEEVLRGYEEKRWNDALVRQRITRYRKDLAAIKELGAE